MFLCMAKLMALSGFQGTNHTVRYITSTVVLLYSCEELLETGQPTFLCTFNSTPKVHRKFCVF